MRGAVVDFILSRGEVPVRLCQWHYRQPIALRSSRQIVGRGSPSSLSSRSEMLRHEMALASSSTI